MDSPSLIDRIKALIPKTITGDSAFDGLLFKGIGIVASAATTWMAVKFNITDPKHLAALGAVMFGTLVMAATLIWGWLSSKFHRQEAVQAGANLVLAGEAIMQTTDSMKVTPKPITEASAKEIVQNFGKVTVANEAAVTDALNEAAKAGAVITPAKP